MTRIVMLNDTPWAISTNPDHSHEQLVHWGRREAERRCGGLAGRVHVHVLHVTNITKRAPGA